MPRPQYGHVYVLNLAYKLIISFPYGVSLAQIKSNGINADLISVKGIWFGFSVPSSNLCLNGWMKITSMHKISVNPLKSDHHTGLGPFTQKQPTINETAISLELIAKYISFKLSK